MQINEFLISMNSMTRNCAILPGTSCLNLRKSCGFVEHVAVLGFASIAMIVLSQRAWSIAVDLDSGVKTLEYGTAFKEMTRSLSQRELALIDEYRRNYVTLRNFYGNVQIEAVVRKTNFRGLKTEQNPNGKNTARLHYRSRDNKLFRIDEETLNWETEESLGRLFVHVAGPEVSFTARKTGPDHSLAIVRVFANPTEVMNESLLQYGELFRAPFSSDGHPTLEEMLFDRPNWPLSLWRISRVEISEDNPNHASIFLDAVLKEDGASGQPMEYRFTFFRDLAWALESYSYGAKTLQSNEDSVWLASFQYDRGVDGLPLLKNATYWVERGPDRRRSNEEVFEVTRFVSEPADVADFLPEALGLSLAGSKANWTGRILILIVGVALLILYFYLKRRASVL
jgi:hypothetical protein